MKYIDWREEKLKDPEVRIALERLMEREGRVLRRKNAYHLLAKRKNRNV